MKYVKIENTYINVDAIASVTIVPPHQENVAYIDYYKIVVATTNAMSFSTTIKDMSKLKAICTQLEIDV